MRQDDAFAIFQLFYQTDDPERRFDGGGSQAYRLMGCKIIFSPQAIVDLESVVRFIAKENPDAAARVGRALIDRVQ